MKKTIPIIFISAIMLLPLFADACPMCQGGASQEKLNAYLLTTAILGALPIVMGILLFFFIRKIKNNPTSRLH